MCQDQALKAKALSSIRKELKEVQPQRIKNVDDLDTSSADKTEE